MFERKFMTKAISLSRENIKKGGGPFGAVIVKEGKIVASGCNRVTCNNDPTAHAEVSAIRKACKKLETFSLENCEIYSSCEPCPMCLSAIYWARISKLYYGNTKKDAAKIGFDDSFIYDELDLPKEKRQIPAQQHLPEQAIEAFNDWKKAENKVEY
ncbi:MAG: nucleoside deaminase [Prevotellaceae bacterium]|jgi:tRNA(Arg) A34 adenosine deaminase TadA|nr:nucleoside deaminase [Prevotellaceae bacterium]